MDLSEYAKKPLRSLGDAWIPHGFLRSRSISAILGKFVQWSHLKRMQRAPKEPAFMRGVVSWFRWWTTLLQPIP